MELKNGAPMLFARDLPFAVFSSPNCLRKYGRATLVLPPCESNVVVGFVSFEIVFKCHAQICGVDDRGLTGGFQRRENSAFPSFLNKIPGDLALET